MRARLRQIGRNIGLIIPASELRALSAGAGDVVDVDIRPTARSVRAGWDDPSRWIGGADEPLLLEGAPDNAFDDGEWEWRKSRGSVSGE